MKKFFLAFMAVATIAMVGCKKENGNTPITPTPGTDTTQVDPGEDVDFPEIDAPEDGYVTFVINIPKNSECNGIAFKGTTTGTWTGANEYLAADGSIADVDDCLKFEEVEDFDNWYVATYKLGEDFGDGKLMAGKICLIYTDDNAWQGQFVDWAVSEDYSTADNGKSNDGNIEIYGGGLVYVTIGGWQGSECVTPEDYNITVLVPEMCEDFDVELIGSFCDWSDDKTVLMNEVAEGKFSATITATEGATWKVRGAGSTDWAIEIQMFDEEAEDPTNPWKGVPDNRLGAELNVTVDYSNAEVYRWKNCPEEEGEE